MQYVVSIVTAVLLLFRFNQRHVVNGACYDSTAERKAITCLTFPKNAALYRNVTATNTCGTPPAVYCMMGPERSCRICDSLSSQNSHPVEFTVDQHNPFNSTWWQSQNWWETNQLGLSRLLQPLQVNLTVALNKEYLISGGVYVTFHSERPKQMVIERSPDFGLTWEPYQYFATNCVSAFGMQADPQITPQNRFKATCTQEYSGQYPSTGGVVVFDPRKRYEVSEYHNDQVRHYLLATDVRLFLTYPGTDGREYLNTEATLNQYYYAISDFKVDARCNCNGHAEFCDFKNGTEVCECKHFTTGRNCQICLPLYNGRPWRAGNYTDANECQECQCNQHATSCVFNNTLGYGVCENCQHNTRGDHCNRCVEKFFRNFDKPLSDVNVCQPCNCYAPGIADDGNCLQEVTSSSVILGQCNCKTGVYGRRCDQCVPGRWGFTNPPEGTCFECGCNRFGTLNANATCNQYTGQCNCKSNIEGRTCNVCKDGFHTFPTQLGADCRPCDCDPGGSLTLCDKSTGQCSCRVGITGYRCDTPMAGFFFPNFTYIILEPDLLLGSDQYQWYWLRKDYGSLFTGFSRLILSAGDSIAVQFQAPVTHNFFLAFRYSLFPPEWYRRVSLYGAENLEWSGTRDFSTYLNNASDAQFWQISLLVKNQSGASLHTITLSLRELLVGDAWGFVGSRSFGLTLGQPYTVSITYSAASLNYGAPWQLVLDSVILTPDLNFVSYFSQSSSAIQSAMQLCQRLSLSLKTMVEMAANCRGYTFSLDAQIYGRLLGCGCTAIGSINPATCEAYGGQCQCRPGFGGRTCYHCLPGYYRMPNGECQECGCSLAGSVTPVCNQSTAACFCKRNTQGLKCSQCKANTFDLSPSNPDGCQECFGFGHLRTCQSALGYSRSLIFTNFTVQERMLWSLFTFDYRNVTVRLTRVPIGIQYIDSTGEMAFFVAPVQYLGNRLFSYGQRVIIHMSLVPQQLQSRSLAWHLRLMGNNQTVLFYLDPQPSNAALIFTTYLHEDFSVNYTTLSTFDMKAVLGQLTAFHILVNYYAAPQTIILRYVAFESAQLSSSSGGTSDIMFVENATCLLGYEGLSCERCIEGYTRATPYGGPLVNCIPCNCNSRSKVCDRDSGVCSNCQAGTTGDHCENCIPNVLPPICDRCIPGYWGLSMSTGCKPCNCYLPGTIGGNTFACDPATGQCQCNSSMNVGGRQCNQCKENSYNISLGELQCKECPPCYGLIEKEVLELHHGLTTLQTTIAKTIMDPSFNTPVPLYQRLTTTTSLVAAVVIRATALVVSSANVTSLWTDLGRRVASLSSTLLSSTAVSFTTTTQTVLLLEGEYNRTIALLYNAQALVVNGFLLLNVSGQGRLNQQTTALNQLQNFQTEMQRYLQISTARLREVTQTATTIQVNINTSMAIATTSSELSQRYRTEASSLSVILKVLENAMQQTSGGNAMLRDHAQEWLTNATQVFAFANATHLEVTSSTVDYYQDITSLNSRTTELLERVKSLAVNITTILRNNIGVAQQISILKQQNSALSENVKNSYTRANDLYARALAAQQRASSAVQSAVSTETEALSVLNILVNFSAIASQAASNAQNALIQVDIATRDTLQSMTNAQNIRNQLAPIKDVVTSSGNLMKEGSVMIKSETEVVDGLYFSARTLKLQSGDYLARLSAIDIERYVATSVKPHLQACYTYQVSSGHVLSNATYALSESRRARDTASSLRQEWIRLGNLVTLLRTLNTTLLSQVQLEVRQFSNSFQALNLASVITNLRLQSQAQQQNIISYRSRLSLVSEQIIRYQEMIQSLSTLTCAA